MKILNNYFISSLHLCYGINKKPLTKGVLGVYIYKTSRNKPYGYIFFHRLASHRSSPIQTITVGFGFAPNQLALTDFELLHHRRLGISPYPEEQIRIQFVAK